MSALPKPSTGPEMDAITRDLHALAKRLDTLAWSLPVREIGQLIARFARQLDMDASRLELLGTLADATDRMSPEKRAEFEQGLARINDDHSQEPH